MRQKIAIAVGSSGIFATATIIIIVVVIATNGNMIIIVYANMVQFFCHFQKLGR
jgi:hypothetical protein